MFVVTLAAAVNMQTQHKTEVKTMIHWVCECLQGDMKDTINILSITNNNENVKLHSERLG